MALGKALVTLVCVGLLAGCSSAEKKSEEVTTSGSAPAETSKNTGASASDMAQKYSLAELSAAANALRVVSETAHSKSGEDRGTEILGCPLTGRQASSMAVSVRSLISRSMRSEREAYTQNPKGYSSEKALESCASTCSCGVLDETGPRGETQSVLFCGEVAEWLKAHDSKSC